VKDKIGRLDLKDAIEVACQASISVRFKVRSVHNFYERFKNYPPDLQDDIHDCLTAMIDAKPYKREKAYAIAKTTLWNKRVKMRAKKRSYYNTVSLDIEIEDEDGNTTPLAETIPDDTCVDFLKALCGYETATECRYYFRSMPKTVREAVRRKMRGWHRKQKMPDGWRRLTPAEKSKDLMRMRRWAERHIPRSLLREFELSR